MRMVEFLEIGDKRGQQRRRRADGAVRSVADRSAVEEDRPLYSRSRPNNARAVVRGSRTGMFWKGFCGFCEAGLAGRTCPKNPRIPRRAGGCEIGRSGAFG